MERKPYQPSRVDPEKYKRERLMSAWKFCLECKRLLRINEECKDCHPVEYDFRENPE